MYKITLNLCWKSEQHEMTFYQERTVWWICNKANTFNTDTLNNSEGLKDYCTVETRCFSFGAKGQTAGEKPWNFGSIYDNSSKIIICLKVERFGINHNREMVGKDEETCRNGHIDLPVEKNPTAFIADWKLLSFFFFK